ncbi:MAG: alanine:cation symporter family protein, partial [Nesterenkonia sp.]
MDLGALNTWLGELEDWLWSGFGIGIVSLVAIYFTIRTKAVQFRMIPAMFRSITDKSQRDESAADNRKSLSAFQAFTISAAARVGTGNISGVAGAIFI